MNHTTSLSPTIIIIFGSTGDLTWRKLIPAIYNLYLDNWLPEHFAVVGIGRSEQTNDQFRKHVQTGVDKFSRTGKSIPAAWERFSHCLSYFQGELSTDTTYAGIEKLIQQYETEWGASCNRLFYLAVPPVFFTDIVTRIGKRSFAKNTLTNRIVIEKPFGYDLQSARELNKLLHGMFDECQIYRIDHYLGKETVQNIMAFRFANLLFEPIWNRNYIDSVQIIMKRRVRCAI